MRSVINIILFIYFELDNLFLLNLFFKISIRQKCSIFNILKSVYISLLFFIWFRNKHKS